MLNTFYKIQVSLHAAKENNLPGVLLLFGFEKCFDSVNSLENALIFLNFGEDIKKNG